jgi:ATP-dependent exoDNAse (exonuclease V) beta subunit
MFGTRDLFLKSDTINNQVNDIVDQLLRDYADRFSNKDGEENTLNKQRLIEMLQKASPTFFLQRLYKQAKLISQIIAYIWRYVGDTDNQKSDTAKQLQQYFRRPTPEENLLPDFGENLKKLLAADPKEESVEAKLLREVFQDYQNTESDFPIFNKYELVIAEDSKNLGYLFEVNVNAFNGVLEDVDRNSPSLFKFVIPFPPRPQIGEGTVTYSELEEWIANRIEKKYFADNPYIPTTCS